jgi:hypothetical protein
LTVDPELSQHWRVEVVVIIRDRVRPGYEDVLHIVESLEKTLLNLKRIALITMRLVAPVPNQRTVMTDNGEHL